MNERECTEKQQAQNNLSVFQGHMGTFQVFSQGGHLSTCTILTLLQRSDRFPEEVPEFGKEGGKIE